MIMMFWNRKIETMKPRTIKKLQEERLRKIVRYAYNNVPMYKKRFKECGLEIESIKTLEDLEKVPFTMKDDLRRHYPYGILAVPLSEIVRIHASSGTTGKPTVVTYTQHDLDTWSELMARVFTASGATRNDVVQNAYGYGLFTGGLGFHYGAERIGAAVVPTSTGNTKKQLMLMKDMKTSVLCCTPSYALYLGEAAIKEGYEPLKDFNLRIGLFGAEPWSEEMRRRIEDVLGLRAFDVYGMSELYGPGVSIECEVQQGMHIWGDEFLVETIDPKSGEVIENGKLGELVFTMLTREAMPLLRYRTRDLAVINEEECECGRCHPKIMRVSGRSDDMLIIGGVNVFPSQVEHVLMSIEGVGDHYQIIIDRDILDKLYVKVETSLESTKDKHYNEEKLRRRVEEELQSVLTVKAKVELLPPETIPRSVGKAKRVLDLRNN